MITAFFTPYYKFLQKDNYIKFFNDIDSLDELIEKIKVKDKIKIYAYSKDIIKFQFDNTNSDFEYEFLKDTRIFEKFVNRGEKVQVKILKEWHDFLGDYIFLVQDRELQREIVKDTDLCAFQATDFNEIVKNVVEHKNIGEKLTAKMFFTDEEMEKIL